MKSFNCTFQHSLQLRTKEFAWDMKTSILTLQVEDDDSPGDWPLITANYTSKKCESTPLTFPVTSLV